MGGDIKMKKLVVAGKIRKTDKGSDKISIKVDECMIPFVIPKEGKCSNCLGVTELYWEEKTSNGTYYYHYGCTNCKETYIYTLEDLKGE